MKQYLDLLKEIKEKGTWKEPARENMPRTLSLFGTRMEFDMKDGFPLLTTKKMYYKGIIAELLWFLKGDTNIKYLVDNGCNIWNQDAYRWYLKQWSSDNARNALNPGFGDFQKAYTLEEFVNKIKNNPHNTSLPQYYNLGDLGKVYGFQWRNQNGVDQINDIVEGLKTNPYSRYHIIDSWNKADFDDMALPPCHLLYQFNCRREDHYMMLDLQMYQRSCDTFLGVPFNIASASLLLHIIAEVVNMIPGKLIWVGGDTHIYENHMDQVNEQLSRTSLKNDCQVFIGKKVCSIKDVEQLNIDDIKIFNYKSHPAIKAELKTGL